jgi:hypothetical protein
MDGMASNDHVDPHADGLAFDGGLARLAGGAHGVAQLLDALLAGDDGLVSKFLAGMAVGDEEGAPV